MSLNDRPRGHGLYNIIAPPHPRDELHATHKHGDPLPVVPDNARTAEGIMRRARDLGVGPLETLRRHLDQEMRRAKARQAELEGGR